MANVYQINSQADIPRFINEITYARGGGFNRPSRRFDVYINGFTRPGNSVPVFINAYGISMGLFMDNLVPGAKELFKRLVPRQFIGHVLSDASAGELSNLISQLLRPTMVRPTDLQRRTISPSDALTRGSMMAMPTSGIAQLREYQRDPDDPRRTLLRTTGIFPSLGRFPQGLEPFPGGLEPFPGGASKRKRTRRTKNKRCSRRTK